MKKIAVFPYTYIFLANAICLVFLAFHRANTTDDSVNLTATRVQETCKLTYDEALETLLDEGMSLILMGEGKMILFDNSGIYYGFKIKEDGTLTGNFFPDLASCEEYLWR